MTQQHRIHDVIDSLLNDLHDDTHPVIPDATIDLSRIVDTLRTLSKDGRAVWSDEEYSIGRMLGRLLDAYIPDEPTEENLVDAILGMSILIGRILRTVPALLPGISIEEFLIDPADQDDLIALGRIMTATPVITEPGGHMRPNIAQLPVFHAPIPLTEEAINGFIERRIAPYDVDLPEGTPLLTAVEIVDIPGPMEDWISDPLNGFDEFFDAYWDEDEQEDD